jgi:XTP/dITP diphosphohydrolase
LEIFFKVRDLIVASGNSHKVGEIKALLKGIPFSIFSLEKYPNVPEIEETGNTYQENALLKAVQVSNMTGCWALGDDTGLEVEAIGGQPGLYSARFAGEGVTFKENNDKLLGLLKDVPEEKRKANFYCVMALAEPTGKTHVVEGKVSGRISMDPRGEQGFGYDPLFFLPELNKTFAEMNPAEKNKFSHRARALEKVREILLSI